MTVKFLLEVGFGFKGRRLTRLGGRNKNDLALGRTISSWLSWVKRRRGEKERRKGKTEIET
jgi:hypothetical protein